MKQLSLKVKAIKKIKPNIFLLSFTSSHLARASQPGNFLHCKVSGVILRRPFSIHRLDHSTVSILFKVKGRGTRALSQCRPGQALDIIGPLGKGFDIGPQSLPVPTAIRQGVNSPQTTDDRRQKSDDRSQTSEDGGENKRAVQNILVAGGMGVAPLVFLAQKLKMLSAERMAQNLLLLGAKNKKEIVCEEDFKKLGFKIRIATEDGSRGYKGMVTDLLRQHVSNTVTRAPHTDNRTPVNIYACGPAAMFRGIHTVIKNKPGINCQVSFEQFMGCGLGICCACVIETKQGYQKVCKDGPVFNIRDIW